jgi:hypothetical protein
MFCDERHDFCDEDKTVEIENYLKLNRAIQAGIRIPAWRALLQLNKGDASPTFIQTT